MNVKEILLKRFDEGTIYGIDRASIEDGNYFLLSEEIFFTTLPPKLQPDSKITLTESNPVFYLYYHRDLDFVPDYFHHSSILTDGALFIQELINENIASLINSYPALHKLPPLNEVESATYTFSDPLITTEYGDFCDKEKHWLKERISCWTPVKFEYKLKEDNPNE